jgi:hypothetical protein
MTKMVKVKGGEDARPDRKLKVRRPSSTEIRAWLIGLNRIVVGGFFFSPFEPL